MSEPDNSVVVTQDDTEQQDADQQRINIWLITILGAALLGLVFGIVFLSVEHESVTLPNGLTSLASLIGGGLLAFLNPAHGIRTSSKSGKAANPATEPTTTTTSTSTSSQ